LLCTFNPIVRVLGLLACDCGGLTGGPTNCFPENDTFILSKTTKVQVGQDVVFYQEEGCIETEKATVCWKNTTVSDDTKFNVSVVYSQQIVVVSSSSKRAALAASQYDIVYNANNQLVGQIVSDAVAVDTGSDSLVIGYIQVCIPLNPSIPIEGTYTTQDFAYSTSPSTNNFVALNTVVTQSGGMWCADVNKGGYYVAALTGTPSPSTVTNPNSGSEMNFVISMLVMLVVMFI